MVGDPRTQRRDAGNAATVPIEAAALMKKFCTGRRKEVAASTSLPCFNNVATSNFGEERERERKVD